MEDVLVCALPVSSRSRWKKAGLAERPDSHSVHWENKTNGASRGAKATGMSEVGSHRITKGRKLPRRLDGFTEANLAS